MSVLLDTNLLLWVLADAARLSASTERALDDTTIKKLVSVVSFWEITIKAAAGKVTLSEPAHEVMERLEREGIATVLPIRAAHLASRRTLPIKHRDPFDRRIVAQALAEDVALVSSDAQLDGYGIEHVW